MMETTNPVTSAEPLSPATASSPDAVRLSLAAAMTLKLRPGRFYRNARLKCINLLQTYPSGCVGRCAYCGLSRTRAAGSSRSDKSFIRVAWPTHSLEEIIDRMEEHRAAFDRVCLSMVTHRGAQEDLITMARRIRARVDVLTSALLTPTLVDREGLEAIRDAGVDRIGIAVDAATPELFDRLRSREGTSGPHKWERYWEGLAEASEVFGPYMAGCHIIVGLGETEEQMVDVFRRARASKCVSHLFSFFPEAGSALEDHRQPSMGQYRRMQLARYLIDEGLADAAPMEFDGQGRLIGFGVDDTVLEGAIASGEPFRTSGCPGENGEVACNRPFANSRPGPDIRNYPFPLEEADVAKVRSELWS